MEIVHVKGKNKGNIMVYALSTCIWCKKTKELLNQLGIEYKYVFVDNLNKEEREKAEKEIKKWNASVSFPTVIINDKSCVVGHKPDELKEKLGL